MPTEEWDVIIKPFWIKLSQVINDFFREIDFLARCLFAHDMIHHYLDLQFIYLINESLPVLDLHQIYV